MNYKKIKEATKNQKDSSFSNGSKSIISSLFDFKPKEKHHVQIKDIELSTKKKEWKRISS